MCFKIAIKRMKACGYLDVMRNCVPHAGSSDSNTFFFAVSSSKRNIKSHGVSGEVTMNFVYRCKIITKSCR